MTRGRRQISLPESRRGPLRLPAGSKARDFMNLNLPAGKLIDISLPLDARTFHMRTYSGFKKDMQFEVEVIKGYEDGGYNQIVRGAHMRLHAGTHVDAPSHMI